MTRDSLKLRLALLVGVLGLAQAIAVLLFAYFTFEQEMQSHRVALLRDKAQQARYLLKEMRNESEVRDNAFRLVELVTGRADLHMAVAGPGQGQAYVAFSPEAAESLQRLRSDTWQTNGLLEWRASRGNGTMLSLAEAGQTKDGRPYELVLTMDRSEDVRVLRELLLTAATVAPLALALVSLSALLIVALGLKPLVVSADVKLTHCAGVKVTHLGDDGGLLAVDVDPGASSGDTCDGPQGRGNQGNREAAWLLAQHRAAVLA